MAGTRYFGTGATRDQDISKHDPEGFLSPLVLERYCEYMTAHREQPDGSIRASDNWQLGIPREAYIKSLWRHLMDLWRLHRGYPVKPQQVGTTMELPTLETVLCAVMFNAMGYLHEVLKARLPYAGEEHGYGSGV